MLPFLRQEVPRTNTASQNPIYYSHSQSFARFHSRSSPYLVTHSLPPATSSTPALFAPPLHYHLTQTERLHVAKGRATFLLSGTPIELAQGESITIPAGKPHRFWNASAEEALEVDIRLDPEAWETEVIFYRNVFGHLEDCARVGRAPSVFQLARMSWPMAAPVALPVPGPEWLARWMSALMLFIVGIVVGEWVLAYRASQREYYKDAAE